MVEAVTSLLREPIQMTGITTRKLGLKFHQHEDMNCFCCLVTPTLCPICECGLLHTQLDWDWKIRNVTTLTWKCLYHVKAWCEQCSTELYQMFDYDVTEELMNAHKKGWADWATVGRMPLSGTAWITTDTAPPRELLKEYVEAWDHDPLHLASLEAELRRMS